jgi:hypothetical protein
LLSAANSFTFSPVLSPFNALAGQQYTRMESDVIAYQAPLFSSLWPSSSMDSDGIAYQPLSAATSLTFSPVLLPFNALAGQQYTRMESDVVAYQAPLALSSPSFQSSGVPAGQRGLSAVRRPDYLRQTPVPSTRTPIGIYHEQTGCTGPKVRVKFSDLELGYIAFWDRSDQANFATYRVLPEIVGNNRTSRLFYVQYFLLAQMTVYYYRCLQAILNDPFARSIFHTRHVECSDRLRNGFETYQKNIHVYTQAKYDEDVAAFHALHPVAPEIDYKDPEYWLYE